MAILGWIVGLFVVLIVARIAYIELIPFGKGLPKPESEYNVSEACYKALGPESGVVERMFDSHKPENFTTRHQSREAIEEEIRQVLIVSVCTPDNIIYSLYKSGLKYGGHVVYRKDTTFIKQNDYAIVMYYINPNRYSRLFDTFLWTHGKYQVGINLGADTDKGLGFT